MLRGPIWQRTGKVPVKCSECGSEKHLAALHVDRKEKPTEPDQVHNGEQKNESQQTRDGKVSQQQNEQPPSITTTCTEICGDKPGGRSCSKICLANIYVNGHPNKKVKAYILIDDQSNCSLATPQLFNMLNIDGERFPYTLRTCAGTMQTEGRHASGLVIETLCGHKRHLLPTVTKCNAIPDNKDEIPTPAIPEFQSDAEILLLVGRDVPPVHKVRESRNGKGDSPWAQREDLGWVILGNACLGIARKPKDLTSCKTNLLQNGRPSILEPCSNAFRVNRPTPTKPRKESFTQGSFEEGLASEVFECTKLDNIPGLYVEDRKFIEIMDAGMEKNESGSWVAPRRFCNKVTHLPNSHHEALNRLKSTRRTLERKPEMKEHYFAFMQKILDNGHAEPVLVSKLNTPKPLWYLPHFVVYHPQKPNKIRVIFDSAAEVNKLLLSGPDLTNSLLGVLLHFRQNPTAFMADVEQMFHFFVVKEEHRDFLRFLWYKDNRPDGAVIEYQMKVHLFGNTSSPAVAAFSLRKTAQEVAQFGSDDRESVERDFYVDDGLKSLSRSAESIDLLQRT